MAFQLFILRGVPDDEAGDIRQLLNTHGIDYYETPAGNWGISMPALWLSNEYQLDIAQSLIEDYQQKRQNRARAEYEKQKSKGKSKIFIDKITMHPIRVIMCFSIIIFILYFSIKPFFNLAQ